MFALFACIVIDLFLTEIIVRTKLSPFKQENGCMFTHIRCREHSIGPFKVSSQCEVHSRGHVIVDDARHSEVPGVDKTLP